MQGGAKGPDEVTIAASSFRSPLLLRGKTGGARAALVVHGSPMHRRSTWVTQAVHGWIVWIRPRLDPLV